MGKTNTKTETTKPSISQALIVMLLVSIIVYIVLRTVFTAYAKYNLLEKSIAVFLLFSEAYVMFHSLAFFIAVFKAGKSEIPEPDTVELNDPPSVDILIPARHEPKEVLESTILACYNLSYPSKTIYVLDDSSEQRYKDEAAELAQRYGCELFRRTSRHGAKAGVINDCVKISTGKYIAVFDVDQNPIDGFLTKTVSILESDSKLALVQTPQYYSNLHLSKVALAANMQQAAFYENICESKSLSGAMMCCGTNVVLRRAAIESVGGFDESTVTEDFATSLQLHLKNWKTVYYNHVGTFGQGPEDLGAYLSQQNRWSMGNVSVLKKVIFNLLKSPFALNFWQWWEYIVTSTYYLVSWAFLLLLLCPIIYIFFGVPSFFMNPVVYSLSFMPYLILSTYIFFTSMKIRRYRYSDLIKGQALFFISLPTYIRGTLLGMLGIRKGFTVTTKDGSHRVSYRQLWPQISLWLICLSAITWGANCFVYSLSPAIAVNTMWITYYFVCSSAVFYFNEG